MDERVLDDAVMDERVLDDAVMDERVLDDLTSQGELFKTEGAAYKKRPLIK